MNKNEFALFGLGAVAGFLAGVLVAGARPLRLERHRRGPTGGSEGRAGANLSTAASESTLTGLLKRQEKAVREAIEELSGRPKDSGTDWGKLAGMVADLTKLEARRQLAELDDATIPFPGKEVVDALRLAVGELEGAVRRSTATSELFSKISAAIKAWKA